MNGLFLLLILLIVLLVAGYALKNSPEGTG
jgi:hypothetical protein